MLLSCVLCDAWCVLFIRPLSGVPCLPFYRPRGRRDYRWKKEEKPEVKKVLRRCQVFFFLCASPAVMADDARDCSMLGACPLILIGPCSGFVTKWSHPILPRRAARRTKVLNRDPTGSRRLSDPTSVTVDDVSFLLDRSGCRMLLSGSVPEGKCRRP